MVSDPNLRHHPSTPTRLVTTLTWSVGPFSLTVTGNDNNNFQWGAWGSVSEGELLLHLLN